MTMYRVMFSLVLSVAIVACIIVFAVRDDPLRAINLQSSERYRDASLVQHELKRKEWMFDAFQHLDPDCPTHVILPAFICAFTGDPVISLLLAYIYESWSFVSSLATTTTTDTYFHRQTDSLVADPLQAVIGIALSMVMQSRRRHPTSPTERPAVHKVKLLSYIFIGSVVVLYVPYPDLPESVPFSRTFLPACAYFICAVVAYGNDGLREKTLCIVCAVVCAQMMAYLGNAYVWRNPLQSSMLWMSVSVAVVGIMCM